MNEEEDTDRQGVFQILGIFENLLSFMPPLAEQIVSDTTLLQWLLKRVEKKEYDSNKQYASEVLAILLQDSRANSLRLAELDGVEVLLKVLSVSTPPSYQRHVEVSRSWLTMTAIPKEGPRRPGRSRIHGESLQRVMLSLGRTRVETVVPGL